ncbi:MAG: hypothetical protein H0T56_14395 [Pseudaminobacter sp.]|nr:hypothetical protein [Pseudaminobacter sp.]
MAEGAGFDAPMGAAVRERLAHASELGSANELVGHLVKVALTSNGLPIKDRELQPQT